MYVTDVCLDVRTRDCMRVCIVCMYVSAVSGCVFVFVCLCVCTDVGMCVMHECVHALMTCMDACMHVIYIYIYIYIYACLHLCM